MHQTPWRLDGRLAHLAVGDLEATVDVAAPHRGIHDLRIGRARDASRLHQIEFPGGRRFAESDIGDAYVRGTDLVVSYAPIGDDPVRYQAYWRTQPIGGPPPESIVLDLILSTQTNLFDQTARAVAIDLLVGEDAALVFDDREEPLALPQGATRCLGPDDRLACLLIHLSESGRGLATMVHPRDVDDVMIRRADGQFHLTCRFASHRLEKGVLFRARARSVLLPRAADTRTARAAYGTFLADPLPLTT